MVSMEIEVKGSTEPYQILLEPYAVVVPGEVLMCTPIHRQFKVVLDASSFLFLTNHMSIKLFPPSFPINDVSFFNIVSVLDVEP